MLNVNTYFEGNVASIGLQTATLPATVGVMNVGKYEFDTSQHEVMTVVNGKLTVKLPGNDQWQDFVTGETFEVPAHSVFYLKVEVQTAYFCTYAKK